MFGLFVYFLFFVVFCRCLLLDEVNLKLEGKGVYWFGSIYFCFIGWRVDLGGKREIYRIFDICRRSYSIVRIE